MEPKTCLLTRLVSGSGNIEVRYALLGKTGLLKTVTYPLGGSVTMDYELTPADVHHSRRWVMTKVEVRDNLPGDGCDSLRTRIRYCKPPKKCKHPPFRTTLKWICKNINNSHINF